MQNYFAYIDPQIRRVVDIDLGFFFFSVCGRYNP
jgi:hypothetical protein